MRPIEGLDLPQVAYGLLRRLLAERIIEVDEDYLLTAMETTTLTPSERFLLEMLPIYAAESSGTPDLTPGPLQRPDLG